MVCHFLPGTSKWNKIEHRMFCHITRNWRGMALISHEPIIKLIGATTMQKGLRIQAQLDDSTYPLGVKVSDEELAGLLIQRADFHGEWNYMISPRV
jgi:Rhodopirellula transposase DDE domain